MENHIIFFRNVKFLELLVNIDSDIANKCKTTQGCSQCKSPLHSAKYLRQFRMPGHEVEDVPDLGVYFGLCCSNRECRCRHRIHSIRFAGRSPNFLGILALVDLLNTPNSEMRKTNAAKLLGLSASTLGRWLRFWRQSTNSGWWRKLLVKYPHLRFPHDLISNKMTIESVVFWMMLFLDLFMDMSMNMALDIHPHKMTDAKLCTTS